MNKKDEEEFKETLNEVTKVLIMSMDAYNLKTHIEMTAKYDGYKYRLRFDKEIDSHVKTKNK